MISDPFGQVSDGMAKMTLNGFYTFIKNRLISDGKIT
jgi:hypothetical protein